MYFDEGGEGRIGVLPVVHVNKQTVGKRSNSMYIFGVCFAFFALSSKGVGRLKCSLTRPKNQKGHNFFLRASNLLEHS